MDVIETIKQQIEGNTIILYMKGPAVSDLPLLIFWTIRKSVLLCLATQTGQHFPSFISKVS